VSAPRRPFVAGNWKMNPQSTREAVGLAMAVRKRTAELRSVDIAVAPPYVALPAVRETLAGGHVAVAAQDVREEEKGAYTAGVSAGMLLEHVDLVIVGHSEVRRDHCDTDARVNGKLRRALAAGLGAILCVGEPLDVRRAGGADEFVRAQIREALQGVDGPELRRVSVAYEPIWAIGTGVPARGEDARETIAAIRDELRKSHGWSVAEATRILYGGSVIAATIGEFASQDGIDGALVGGASLRPEEFAEIARIIGESTS
jgi:triosephosphate isomerase